MKLKDLEGQVIELTIMIEKSRGKEFVDVAGLVQYVALSPACWVGTACITEDAVVEPRDNKPGCYVYRV